jgi:hypothetical protein
MPCGVEEVDLQLRRINYDRKKRFTEQSPENMASVTNFAQSVTSDSANVRRLPSISVMRSPSLSQKRKQPVENRIKLFLV